MRSGEDCPSALWRHAARGPHGSQSPTRSLLICQVALPCYANAERGDCQVSVPLTHSEVIRVRDRPNIPKPCTASDAEVNPAGLVDALIAIGRERQRIMDAMKAALRRGDDVAALAHARELTGLPSQKSPVSSVTT